MNWKVGIAVGLGLLALMACSQNANHPKINPPLLESASQSESVQLNALVDGLRMQEAIALAKFMQEPMNSSGVSNSRLSELKRVIQEECFVRPTRRDADFAYRNFSKNFKVYEHYEANNCPIYAKQESAAQPASTISTHQVQSSTFNVSFDLGDSKYASIIFVPKANLKGTYVKEVKRKSHNINVHTTEMTILVRVTDWDGSDMEYYQSETNTFTETFGTVLSKHSKTVTIVKSPQGDVELVYTARPINKSGKLEETYTLSGRTVTEKVYTQRFLDAEQRLAEEAHSEDYPTGEYPDPTYPTYP